jgi:dimeric dUTPase (all-alpha-NTP-PPase superfamily)
MKTHDIFKTMVELQHKFNKQVADDYLDKNFNWNSAIIAESGELLDSLGYKWWKKQVQDMDNVKVEAIDLLHFVISETIQYFYNNPTSTDFIEKTIEYFHFDFEDDPELIRNYNNFTIERLIGKLLKEDAGEDRFVLLKVLFHRLDMTNEDVYIAYIVKNCLNKFRQDNGYKKGTYIKDWNGKEDNVIAYVLAKEIGAVDNLFEELNEYLTFIYLKDIKTTR